jgi:hypothetical protein
LDLDEPAPSVFVYGSGELIMKALFGLTFAIAAFGATLIPGLDQLPGKKSPVKNPASVLAPPVYYGNVDRILAEKCVSCHRAGGVAPFSLDSFAQAKSRGPMIKFVTTQGQMPPWFADKAGGPWRNDMSLSADQKRILHAWIDGGMPAGKASDATPKKAYAEGWTIGKPDVVFQIPKPISIPADGVMPYQNVQVPTGFTEDKWVEKIEVVPGDRRAVHHVLVFVRGSKDAGPTGALAEGLEELGGFVGVYVPGNSALTYTPGLAKRVPRGAELRFQIHYTPFGEAIKDQTKIGLVFAKTPPNLEVHTASLASLLLRIPPKAENHQVTAQLNVPSDVQILSFLPHMHVRGKAARYSVVRKGQEQVLLNVPRYDFNWQLNYVAQNPIRVSNGDTLRFDAWYDNSDNNPANPDSSKTVRWGPQTFDEMHLGYVEYTVPGEVPGSGSGVLKRAGGLREGIGRINQLFQQLDENSDGFLVESEVPAALWSRIKGADKDGDGRVSLADIAAFLGRG